MSTAALLAVRTQLERVFAEIEALGCASPGAARGQLIRPLLAVAGARAIGAEADERFWQAVAAVQLAHEASLLHDDVIDGAQMRRGQPTTASVRGPAAALVEGDHLLTTAYRLAAATSSVPFFSAFARAVERTVAGERLQGRADGQVLEEPAYRDIIALKSGELIGCALAAASLLAGHDSAAVMQAIGRSMGTFYQLIDDFLDYCPLAETGKSPLADFRQRRWTWPLLHADIRFEDDEQLVLRKLTAPHSGTTPLSACLADVEREADLLRNAIAVHLPSDAIATGLMERWLATARTAVERTMNVAVEDRFRASFLRRSPGPAELRDYFERHSQSFAFAARLYPSEFRRAVEGLFAFCRVTDDLADDDDQLPAGERLLRLERWELLARDAYHGRLSGIPLLDVVMRDAANARVPFAYVAELIEGMRMDVRGCTYQSYDELRTYTYRVAGVIGQWLTRLAGEHDEWMLQQAATLGHALQLTNIVRDVGEDLQRGRIYIPSEAMRGCGLTAEDLHAFARGAERPSAYVALLEDVMSRADLAYASALSATPLLPSWFGRTVSVAAHVYHGIHEAIRRNGYDNFTMRAQTSRLEKVQIAASTVSGSDPILLIARRMARSTASTHLQPNDA